MRHCGRVVLLQDIPETPDEVHAMVSSLPAVVLFICERSSQKQYVVAWYIWLHSSDQTDEDKLEAICSELVCSGNEYLLFCISLKVNLGYPAMFTRLGFNRHFASKQDTLTVYSYFARSPTFKVQVILMAHTICWKAICTYISTSSEISQFCPKSRLFIRPATNTIAN
jgi:hypothetical protein